MIDTGPYCRMVGPKDQSGADRPEDRQQAAAGQERGGAGLWFVE